MSSHGTGPVSIVLLCSIDTVIRDSAAVGLLLDLPNAVVVSHDLVSDHVAGEHRGRVRRVISDQSGLLSDDTNPLNHACLSCTVRDDIVPTVQMLVSSGRWQTIILALPLTAAPAPVAFELNQAIADGSIDPARLCSVVSLVDLETIRHDLLGDELLSERGMALGTPDRRSVGESLASQIEFADLVVTLASGAPRSRSLLQHLVAPTSQLHLSLHELRVRDLIERQHDIRIARSRIDPRKAQPSGARDNDQVWTIDLRSERPLHPKRLLTGIEALGAGELRSRGRFWLASRPTTVCVWDGAGGQVSIGNVGSWDAERPDTRLVITGVGGAVRNRVEQAFADIVMTADEVQSGIGTCQGAGDGFEPWLGEKTANG